MARLKRHDTNVPAAIDWAAAEHAIRAAITKCRHSGVPLLLVEGFLLLSQPRVASLLDRCIYLSVEEGEQSDELMRRKWQRTHLGKASYQERGISIGEYRAYWSECVFSV